MKTYIVRINNDKMLDRYFLTYNEALDECAICKELFSDAQVIEEDL